MDNKIYNILKIILLASIVIVLLVINNNIRVIGHSITSKLNQKTELNKPTKIPLSKDKGIFIGLPNANLTITAFIDYECIFCNRFVNEVYPLIEKEYIKSGIVKMEYRNLPLTMHPNAFYAAKSAICANKFNKFSNVHNALYKETPNINKSKIQEIISKSDINKDDFQNCIIDSSTTNKVNYDVNECMKYNITATPTFIINGNVYIGLIPYADFKKIIDKEIANIK